MALKRRKQEEEETKEQEVQRRKGGKERFPNLWVTFFSPARFALCVRACVDIVEDKALSQPLA